MTTATMNGRTSLDGVQGGDHLGVVKPSELARVIVAMHAIDLPLFVWGAPGVGKSDIIRQVAATLFADSYGLVLDEHGHVHDQAGKLLRLGQYPFVRDVRLLTMDPVDARGLPFVANGRTGWAMPDWIPTEGAGFVLLDELTRAPQLVQGTALEIALDHRAGSHAIAEDWYVIAASNRYTDGAGVNKLNPALANRFVHVEVQEDVNDWCLWAAREGLEPMVIAFIRSRPEMLNQFSTTARAYPSPRSVARVSKILSQRLPEDLQHKLITGTTGLRWALDYASFERTYASLPDPQGILEDPDAYPAPTDMATRYMVASALARWVEPSNLGNMVRFLDKLPQEFAVKSMMEAIARNPLLQRTHQFVDWGVKHQDVMGFA